MNPSKAIEQDALPTQPTETRAAQLTLGQLRSPADLAQAELDRLAGEAWSAAAKDALDRGVPVTFIRAGRLVTKGANQDHADALPELT